MADVTSRWLMWEVRACADRVDELVAYVTAHADPAAQVFRSDGDDPRVVVIDPTGRCVPDVPPDLLARAPHEWHFEAVPRPRLGCTRARRAAESTRDAQT